MGKYIPEFDYKARGYEPFGNNLPDMCKNCVSYYRHLYEEKLTDSPFPPVCNKHVLEKLNDLTPLDFGSEEEYKEVIRVLDPVSWAATELGWQARWYQERMLSCTSKRKLYRMGRRMGKSHAMAVEALHHAVTNSRNSVLIAAPYEAQVILFFDIIREMIATSNSILQSVSRDIKTPSRIEFFNGSKIIGFSAGASSGSKSDKIRGQDAHLIIVDEIDTLQDKDLDAIMAIIASHPTCKLIGASTPRGWIRKFYGFSRDKNLGFKEFWFVAAEAPTWTAESEKMFKASYTEAAYTQEFLADFGDTEAGVFKKKFIDKSLKDYDISNIQPQPGGAYIFGIDWNKSAGTHIVILQWTEKLTLVKKIIVPESEYIQTDSVNRIIKLNDIWKPRYIFVDHGYGTTQVELLKKYGKEHEESRLHIKLVPIAMQEHIEIIDPITREPVGRPAKPYLVMQTAKALEDDMLVLPISEDTTNIINQSGMGLIQQMRNFLVDGYSNLGLPRYTGDNDDTLTAYMLAVGGLIWKEGDLKRRPPVDGFVFFETNNDKIISREDGHGGAKDLTSEIAVVLSRGLDDHASINKGMSSLSEIQRNRKQFLENPTENFKKNVSGGISRKNLDSFKRKSF